MECWLIVLDLVCSKQYSSSPFPHPSSPWRDLNNFRIMDFDLIWISFSSLWFYFRSICVFPSPPDFFWFLVVSVWIDTAGTTIQKPAIELFDPTVSRLVKTKSATLPRMSSAAVVADNSASSPEVVTKVQYKSMSLFVIILLLLLIALNAFLYVKLWELEKMEAHKFQYPDFAKLRWVFCFFVD